MAFRRLAHFEVAVIIEHSDPTIVDAPVARLVDRAVRSMIDATRNNPLLYYRPGGALRFSLPAIDSPLVAKLLAGDDVRGDDFEPVAAALDVAKPASDGDASEGDERPDAAAVSRGRRPRGRSAAASTPLQTRLQKIRAKARENAEERGLQTLFAAVGMVTWPARDGGRAPLAPLFLVPAEIVEDRAVRGDFVVRRVADGEPVFNRAILAVAPAAFREIVGEIVDGAVVDDLGAAFERVRSAANGLGGVVSLEPTCALGIFNYAMMAVVTDLLEGGDALAEHPVIRALAGDAEAQTRLTSMREGAVELGDLDDIPPAGEPFVLDADPWQSQTIQTLRRYEDSHATIDGPPGSGKSQTIANLIAALIAQGKSVLFCCEKRAALDVVKTRLEHAGLGHLVLDLHGAGVTRQRAFAQLKRSRKAVTAAAAPATDLDPVLERTRAELVAHDRFMHAPPADGGETPYRLMAALLALPACDPTLRVPPAVAQALRPELESVENDLREAARWPATMLRDATVPWAAARDLATEAVPAALERASAVAASLAALRAILAKLGVEIATRSELEAAVDTMRSMRAAFATCAAGVCELDPATAEAAARTLASPLGWLTRLFSPRASAAARSVRPFARTASPVDVARAIRELLALPPAWQRRAGAVAELAPSVDETLATIVDALAGMERLSGRGLPTDVAEMSAWIASCARDRDAAYRSARAGEIERRLARAGLESFVVALPSLAPAAWAQTLRVLYLQSRLEPLRPQLVRFDGRTHDGVVARFAAVERDLRAVAGDRVRRAAAERFIRAGSEHPEQAPTLNVELERARPKKSLRKLFEDVPDLLLALAPCVMASPLTVSQFLPRASLFDVVVFDEGSQMTPESTLAAIARGSRVVVAGDDRQLPPTSFFASTVDEDDGDDEGRVDAAAGTESILAALRSFTKPLGLRVHYRSRDESLIAFSNHYLYDDALITFPGARDGGREALEFVYVEPSSGEIDEDSAAPEVVKVVELVLEHARTTPELSLGVIALGSKHALRIDTHLARERRSRPELDAFFDDTKPDAFFVKNLERVQGDERDRIVLTIGYGRTKTGSVSHNFGPMNQAGGERRLNVAITRARTSMTLVSSFRKADLNPTALVSTGAKLLAAYLGYVESHGRDLGRDGAVASVAPSGIELDVQRALEERLGTTLVAQYGVGAFRIDLVVQDPRQPGRFVLAIEFDGATYHSSPTARLRDRQRQQILEGMGWRFCRIWSTDWFERRDAELARVEAAYRSALDADATSAASAMTDASPEPSTAPPSTPPRAGRCPLGPIASIGSVSDADLLRLLAWISSDGLLRDDRELFEEMFAICGFRRRGARIEERFDAAITKFRNGRP